MEKKKSIFKKWWFWVIVVIVVGAIGGAAGGGNHDKDTGKKQAVESGDKQDKTEDKDSTKDKENTDKKEETEKQKEATVEEKVILEQDGMKIILKELDDSGFMGPEIKLSLENTSSKNLTVQTRSVSVNGVMVESLFSCEVAAGKNANDSITLLKSDLETAGIANIQNVELSFHVFDTESWYTVFDSDTIYIATSMDGTEEQAVDDRGVLLMEQDGIKLTVKEADNEDSFWGADIYIYVENTTDKNVTVQARNVSINGFMVEPMFSCEVAAGKKAYDTITFLESNLEENGITSIDDMEISFHVFDTDSWDTIFDSENLKVSFSK